MSNGQPISNSEHRVTVWLPILVPLFSMFISAASVWIGLTHKVETLTNTINITNEATILNARDIHQLKLDVTKLRGDMNLEMNQLKGEIKANTKDVRSIEDDLQSHSADKASH